MQHRTTHQLWIHSALGGTEFMPSSILLWGCHSTGKRYVLNQTLQNLKSEIVREAHIDAEEILAGPKAFFETIIQQLGAPTNVRCENPRIFLRRLEFLYKITGLDSSDRAVVVIYRAENLVKYQDILYAFINAQHFIRKNICFILCSTLPWESLQGSTLQDIPRLHFQQYKSEELKTILVSEWRKTSLPVDTYSFYINTIVDYFFTCRDLKLLRRLANSQFDEYSRRVNELETSNQRNLHRLFKIIEPGLKEEYKNINSNLAPIFSSEIGVSHVINQGKLTIFDDMPLYSKYILIAAYLASHNPVSSDQKYFVKQRGERKRRKREEFEAKLTSQTFTLNRLMAILVSLNHEVYIPLGTDVRSQISSLCSIGLLARIGDDLEDCKYKCVAENDLITLISQSIGFELQEYIC